MLVFNQQANIKNVNGAIADIFANRPAAQSTYYIFYSTDTQEIFYDNGAWILIGSGGGGVNIYNSDGTLTGNRRLFGDNYFLRFQNLNEFRVQNVNFNYDLIINQTSIQLQSSNLKFNLINTINVIKTQYQSNDIGLKLDFANQFYTLGDPGNFAGGFAFIIDDLNGVITTQSSPGVNGLYFDFANDYYRLGAFSNVNFTYLDVDNANQIIKTSNQGNDIGLKLDFANSKYQFGQITGGNNLFLNLDDVNGELNLIDINGIQGLNVAIGSNVYEFGDLMNDLAFRISGGPLLIRTTYQGSDIGLKLDFANKTYQFGNYSGSNENYILVDDNGTTISTTIDNIFQGLVLQNSFFRIGDYNSINNSTFLEGNDFTQIIKTSNQGNDIGLKLDFANKTYQFGQLTGGNTTYLYINDTSQLLYTANNGNISNGLYCDFAAHVYQFGRATGGNTTYLTIDDAATYPIQIDGTNVLSGSAGSTSSQHLKININGTDYKIELKNP